MKEKFAFITRCTRQENLKAVGDSLTEAISQGHSWHIIFDLSGIPNLSVETLAYLGSVNCQYYFKKSEPFTYGYDIMNDVIRNNVPSGHWVHILDDDNILHEDFLSAVKDIVNGKHNVIIVDQKVDGKDFTRLDVRIASHENTKLQGVDVGQILINRDFLIKNGGYDLGYCGDGLAIERIHKEHPKEFYYLNKILSYYNKIEKPRRGSEPRVLYIGELPETQQEGGSHADYESGKLIIHHILDDSNIGEEIFKFDPDVVITRSASQTDYPNLYNYPLSVRRKWVHFVNDIDTNQGYQIYNVAMNAMLKRDQNLASIFTSAYNIGKRAYVAYNSLKEQTYNNWEWVVVNDSNDNGKTQKVLEEIAKKDPRVKLYSFEQKSKGVIGESKYRAAVLCNGEYLMELDHDDELMPDAVELMVRAFVEYPDAGFVYSDCMECDTEFNTTRYVEGFALGYGNYYLDTHKGKTVDINACVPVNPKTIRHIVGVPNHFRAWRRSVYHNLGGHNRRLTIADDYELVVRSFLSTRFVRIPKNCYIQYYYGQNTQDANGGDTRQDIQRRVRTIAQFYSEDIKKRFEELGMTDWAYEENPNNPLWTPSKMDSPDAAYTLKL